MTELNSLIEKIKKELESGNQTSQTPQATSTQGKMTVQDYPLFDKHADLVRSPSGKALNEITLDNVMQDKINSKDLRVTRETLKYQGEIAQDAGRGALQQNFARAAELTDIPDERLLEMYVALRPYRSSKQELFDMAKELEDKYQATITAQFITEAANYYETRKKLKGDN